MDHICNQNECTGCSACFSVCKHEAIQMNVASDGFFHPVIDANKCVDCKLCQHVCPSNSLPSLNDPQKVFLTWTTHDEYRQNSSSGGMFSAVAAYVLDHGGVVFGASYDENMNVCHRSIRDKKDLPLLQGSKYVQSSIGTCFKEIKTLLNNQTLVYFVGTPCLVAGLKKYLRKDYSNLITSDLICHGCPSNDLFQKQISDIGRDVKGKIIDFKFRSKKRFGQGYDLQVVTQNNNKVRNRFYNAELLPYFYGFWHNITLRESCYSCKYAKLQRTGDITLADYWSVKKFHPGIKTSKGTSMILTNTQKGLEICKKLLEDKKLVLIEDNIENAMKVQCHLSVSVGKPSAHNEFLREYSRLSWTDLKQKYLKPSLKYELKMRIRNIGKIVTFYKLWK